MLNLHEHDKWYTLTSNYLNEQTLNLHGHDRWYIITSITRYFVHWDKQYNAPWIRIIYIAWADFDS